MREWLRDLRKAKGLTVKELGSFIGVSEAYMFSIERGERQKRMDIDLLAKISVVTGASLYDLLERELDYEGIGNHSRS